MDQLKSESSNDQTEGLKQTQPIDSVADSDSPVDSPKDSPKDSPTGYATIGKRITNFTTNLLATSVITMVALVAGSHFVSSLRPLTQATDDSISTELTNAWPVLESCALQFGESNIELQRDSLIGNREEVLGFLQSKCRDVLEQNLVPTGEPLDNEASLVSELLKSNSVQPVQESPGQWRIFQIEKPELNSPLPLVIGIRDDAPLPSNGDEGELEAKPKTGSRLAVWGLALPGGPLKSDTTDTTGDTLKTGTNDQSPDIEADIQWTSFVGSSVAKDELHELKTDLIPATARRTLAIAGPNGDTLIGFNGEEITSTKSFFDELAAEHSWEATQAWQQSGDSWSVRFKLPPDSPAQGIQVQLNVNHNQDTDAQTVRGILTVQSSKRAIETQ